jgi:redox-sensitive bicupin YhaK (pirin superfamily)
MFAIRKRDDRGHFDHGWLDTYHTFSFGDYYDPQQMGFRALRVINEDRVAPGGGFGMHGHRDMEIVTCVLSGALEHKDSLGHGEVLRPGEMQHMSAGRGIRHSEFNPSATEPVHLYQIWLLPRTTGLTPSYSQKAFDASARASNWQLVASPDGAEGSLKIEQDARILLANLGSAGVLEFNFAANRHGWLQILRGTVGLNDSELEAGDGVAISNESLLKLAAQSPAEVMLFDLA